MNILKRITAFIVATWLLGTVITFTYAFYVGGINPPLWWGWCSN